MGTKFGGDQYSSYIALRGQRKITDTPQTDRTIEYETNFEDLVTTKLKKTDPKSSDLKSLNSYAEVIQRVVARELDIEERRLFGSVTKGTMINSSHKKDIDILIVINHEKYHAWLIDENGPTKALNRLRDTILKAPEFSGSQVQVDKNAVVVTKDGKSVDVVLGFKNPGRRGYLIPDTHNGGNWIETDPRLNKRILQIADKQNFGQVTPLIRLAKDWNERNGAKLTSYQVEAIVLTHFKNRPAKPDSLLHSSVDEFFYLLPEYISNPIEDPVTRKEIEIRLNEQEKEQVIDKAIISRRYVEEARYMRGLGMNDSSLDLYKKVINTEEE